MSNVYLLFLLYNSNELWIYMAGPLKQVLFPKVKLVFQLAETQAWERIAECEIGTRETQFLLKR